MKDNVFEEMNKAHQARRREKRKVIAKSEGHEWVNYQEMVCCRICGRRIDELPYPSQCKGPVKIAPREK